jgi:hypothetical protein
MLTQVDSVEISGIDVDDQVPECLIQSLHGIFRSATKLRLGYMQFMQPHHWAQLMLQIPYLEILDMAHGSEMMLNALYPPASVPEGWMLELSSHCRNAGKRSWSSLRQMRLYIKEVSYIESAELPQWFVHGNLTRNLEKLDLSRSSSSLLVSLWEMVRNTAPTLKTLSLPIPTSSIVTHNLGRLPTVTFPRLSHLTLWNRSNNQSLARVITILEAIHSSTCLSQLVLDHVGLLELSLETDEVETTSLWSRLDDVVDKKFQVLHEAIIHVVLYADQNQLQNDKRQPRIPAKEYNISQAMPRLSSRGITQLSVRNLASRDYYSREWVTPLF